MRPFQNCQSLPAPLVRSLGSERGTGASWRKRLAAFWYGSLHRLCCRLYFSQISVLNAERLPAKGPVLYVGLHRNGAVDGFIYHSLLPKAVFMISTQLRKNWLGRIFFDGIAVTRTKDAGDRTMNAEALQRCRELLGSGGEIFIFPEGTSWLGPRHLPFKSGAAKLAVDFVAEDHALQVVPLGIHYECPWGFRSKVEVVVGQPILLGPPDKAESVKEGLSQFETPPSTSCCSMAQRSSGFKEVKRGMQTALEEVGINVESEGYQHQVQQLAYIATLGTNRSYFKTLKGLESGIPQTILRSWRELEKELRNRILLRHQGVPLFPLHSSFVYAAALILLAPVVLAAMALNLPPLVAGWWAGKRFPDDRNVISLWRILAGLPLFLVWFGSLTVAAICFHKLLWLAGYCVLTWLGLKLYYRVKKLAVAVHNGLRHPELGERVLAFRATVLQAFSELAIAARRAPSPLNGQRAVRDENADESPADRPNLHGHHSSEHTQSPVTRWPLLPHEALFGIFLISTWIRLVFARGFASSAALLYSFLIALNALLILRCARKETSLRWRARLLFYPATLNVLFAHLKFVIPQIHPDRMDAVLQHIDSALIGTNLTLRLESFTYPFVTEILSFCYLLFFPYLAFSVIRYLFADLELCKKFMIGLFSIYGLGLLGYTLAPAQGPYLAMAEQFRVPLTGGCFTHWNAQVVQFGSNGFDVFPSLHCAIIVYLLLFDRAHAPWRFRLLLVPCVGLWFSTLYLRYHYFIDLPCGFGLGIFSLWLANKYSTKEQHETHPLIYRPAVHESRA